MCSIGGNVAQNSGGAHCFKYGLLKINTKFLPKQIQRSTTRKVLRVFMALFYEYFVCLFLMGGFPVATEKGFIFNFVELTTETE